MLLLCGIVLCLKFSGTNLVAIPQKCPNGDEIYAYGIDAQGKVTVVNEHNRWRQALVYGQVLGQPRAKFMQTVSFDDVLSAKCSSVLSTCKMQHVIATDERWSWVGQNLYITWNSKYSTDQNWTEAVLSWFDENKMFKFPQRATGTGHYTQLIWHNTQKIGCNFVNFHDSSKPRSPYAKLYTCNYGPGGNIGNQLPYEVAQ